MVILNVIKYLSNVFFIDLECDDLQMISDVLSNVQYEQGLTEWRLEISENVGSNTWGSSAEVPGILSVKGADGDWKNFNDFLPYVFT